MTEHELRISEVFNEDCMIGMARYPDKYFDLAVVDIEYGIGASKPSIKPCKVIQKNGGTLNVRQSNYPPKEWDFKKSDDAYFGELFRVSTHQIVWGGNYYNQLAGGCIVWDKLNSGDFADCELAWTSFNTAVRKFTWRWSGMLQQNMKDKEHRIHPTQKPVALYDWIYAKYLPQGGKVIDTHLGSGSNRIAADKAGNIDFVGFEIDKDYYEAQEKRWKAFKAQTRLI